jgi:WD40 repeat protein
MLRYDEISSSLFFFDEIKSSQLENKNITCMEFLYSQPVIAVGCSDGVIRLWNYNTKSIVKNVPSATKGIQKMIAVAVCYLLKIF